VGVVSKGTELGLVTVPARLTNVASSTVCNSLSGGNVDVVLFPDFKFHDPSSTAFLVMKSGKS
jgi:hypothetical protein